MEVVLKKMKITASIMKQVVQTDRDLDTGIVLGWCIVDKVKWIVVYKESLLRLTKFLYFDSIDISEHYNEKTIYLKYEKYPNRYTKVKFDNLEQMNEYIKLLKQIKHFADSKGQFYL